MTDVAMFELAPPAHLPAATVLVDAAALKEALARVARFPKKTALSKTRADLRCLWMWGCERRLAVFGRDMVCAGQHVVPTDGPADQVPLVGIEPDEAKAAGEALGKVKGLVAVSVLGDRLMLTPRDEKTPGWVGGLCTPNERELRHLRLLMDKIIAHAQRIAEGRVRLPHASVVMNPALLAKFAGEPEDTRLWFTSEFGGVLVKVGPHFCGVAMPVRPKAGSSVSMPTPPSPTPLPQAPAGDVIALPQPDAMKGELSRAS
ncbi:hypothetical protein [Micromonospora maritima]|uniref:hypothetical protein n=1 Tax=Micromonospora maritima TaxID=986711 RepID=UPI00157BECE5|nr:hypothetical protein [Micromonospora maritima]